MSKSKRLTIRCWVESHTQNNVVTIRGATNEQADLILRNVRESFPTGSFSQDGQKTLWLFAPDVIVHHYRNAGGEIELMSESFNHQQLLDLIPALVRTQAGV